MPILRVHASYHKCLTALFLKIANSSLKHLQWISSKDRYKHCNSLIDEFYEKNGNHIVTSVNNHYVNIEGNRNYRITRFIRDPRDLIVSGYFYHKRGAEEWTKINNPSEEHWKVVNGNIPERLKEYGGSYVDYLNSVPLEEGLRAEIEFRKFHFESMLKWPLDTSDIKLYKYEEVMGNEIKTFIDIYKFYEFDFFTLKLVEHYTKKYSSITHKQKNTHVRNSSSGQWKEIFTPKIKTEFGQQYMEILEKYNYPKN